MNTDFKLFCYVKQKALKGSIPNEYLVSFLFVYLLQTTIIIVI